MSYTDRLVLIICFIFLLFCFLLMGLCAWKDNVDAENSYEAWKKVEKRQDISLEEFKLYRRTFRKGIWE